MYRQPIALAEVRANLLAVFGFTTILRNGAVAASGGMSGEVLITSALCLPGVWLATWLGQRFPPPLPERGMRRLAFGLLTLLGLTLVF